MAGQGRQGHAALLAAAAGQLIAFEHFDQQIPIEGARALVGCMGGQAPQVGPVGGGPGAAATRRPASALRIVAKCDLKRFELFGQGPKRQAPGNGSITGRPPPDGDGASALPFVPLKAP